MTAEAAELDGEAHADAHQELLAPIWSYLAIEDAPLHGDAVFAFGCASLRVPQRAANLHLEGLAPHVLVSGGAGRRAGALFGATEAAVFARRLRWLGVPDAAIVTEDRATNTGENVALGMLALQRRGVSAGRVLLVAKPLGMRRCAATFRLRHPRVETVCCPPRGPMLEFVEGTRAAFAARLLAELERLERYPRLGFIAAEPFPVPRRVAEAAARVRRLLEADGLIGGPPQRAGAGGALSGAGRRPGPPDRR